LIDSLFRSARRAHRESSGKVDAGSRQENQRQMNRKSFLFISNKKDSRAHCGLMVPLSRLKLVQKCKMRNDVLVRKAVQLIGSLHQANRERRFEQRSATIT
jgi:hypothetical protein